MDESEYCKFLKIKKYNDQKLSTRAVKEKKNGRAKVESRDPEAFELRMKRKKNSKKKTKKK